MRILPRQIGPARARDMLLTGRTISAAQAEQWGLVSRVAPHDQLLEAATEALVAACRSAPVARADTKRSVDAYYGLYDRIGMINSLPSASRWAAKAFATLRVILRIRWKKKARSVTPMAPRVSSTLNRWLHFST